PRRGAAAALPRQSVGTVVGGVNTLERWRLALGVERFRQPRHTAQVGRRRRLRGPHVLDRDVEQPLEPLLDELANLLVEDRPWDRQPALDRQPAEADRSSAEPIWVA